MSGLYLPGMEMPSCCDKCIYSGWSNFYQMYICTARWRAHKNEALLFDKKHTNSVATMRSGRADNCPLIPVPDHGRLIDADAILNEKGIGTQIAGWGKMFHETVIEYAPTIIPTNKEAGE